MGTRTGKLFSLNKDLVEVNPEDMTFKQKTEMKVSLHDNRSKLGKQRLSAIEERKAVFGK